MEAEKSYIETLLQTRLEIQEETFRTISREIHDNIGQALSFIKLNLSTIDPVNTEMVTTKLNESKNLLSKTIQQLRNVARNLDPGFIQEVGLVNAVGQQLQMIEKSGAHNTVFIQKGAPFSIGIQNGFVIYRTIQELLNNIVKHAEATTIQIEMHYLSDTLKIIVSDNGKGFDAAAIKNTMSNGLGIKNIQKRMSLIHATVDFKSAAGKGTTVTVQLTK